MNSNQKNKFTNTFTGLMNTDLAQELMSPDKYAYMLNCNITSSSEGNLGIVTNTKGDVAILVDLPEGENKTLGITLDEENNRFFFPVWNSRGYHTWYMFDAVSLGVSIILQCITDTGGVDIFNWKRSDIILHSNVIGKDKLYWSMTGHPARKFNIDKAIDKSLLGYGDVIKEDYTRAYKKTADYPPTASYFTDSNTKFNFLYGKLFKFAVRFIYDDREYSVFSDYSVVPTPSIENVSGVDGVPLENNAIAVNFLTGGMTVKKIELVMQMTNVEGGVRDWVSIEVLDKEVLGISDNSEYTYNFYNDNTYLSLIQSDVIQPHSYLPTNPSCQEFVNNSMVYFNFKEGFAPVKVDITTDVLYEDLFIPDGTENKLNEPFIEIRKIREWSESGGLFSKSWKHYTGALYIGPDVKKGNKFVVNILSEGRVQSTYEYTANLSDDARTVATYFANIFKTHDRMDGAVNSNEGWVDKVEGNVAGQYFFTFDIWNNAGKPYHTFSTSVNAVRYNTLKNTGNSVLTHKLGSARRYGLVYEDDDQKNSLTYGNIEAIYIKPLNELGGYKNIKVVLNVNHRAPEWATTYKVVATNNLVQSDFIDVLIQAKVNKVNVLGGESYTDFIIGSLNTYNEAFPNSVLTYDFKKGDRLRLQKMYDVATELWTIPTDVIDYEIIGYFPEVTTIVNEDVKIDGTSKVSVANPDINNKGSNISINGSERTIIDIEDGKYVLDANISTSDGTSSASYPSFSIINRRGILRVKLSPDYPIDVEAETRYALVEIYNPYQTLTNVENEPYYSIGYKFPIVQQDGVFLHTGNMEDQTLTSPAKISIGGLDNYVRNRGLPVNNNISNLQVVVTSVEDKSYSDFYVSNMSSRGKPSILDDSTGVVDFDSRGRFSKVFLENTKINGLNMFDNLDRVDYDDKYGPVMLIRFFEGRLYIFKYNKTCWTPVSGNIITDQEGNEFIAASNRLLADTPQYFLWEGGVGDNPESVVRDGNDFFGVSPNSGVVFRIGGNGIIPLSKQFGMDKELRNLIANASKSRARMYGAFDRKNNKYVVAIEKYDEIVYNITISSNNHEIVFKPNSANYELVTNPQHGTVYLSQGVFTYSAAQNYVGKDQFSYRAIGGEVVNVELNVLGVETAVAWRPIGQYCVID